MNTCEGCLFLRWKKPLNNKGTHFLCEWKTQINRHKVGFYMDTTDTCHKFRKRKALTIKTK